MKRRSTTKNDYEPVRRSRSLVAASKIAGRNCQIKDQCRQATNRHSEAERRVVEDKNLIVDPMLSNSTRNGSATTFLKHGHFFSFVALFLFTLILYTRPAEFYPSPLTASIALSSYRIEMTRTKRAESDRAGQFAAHRKQATHFSRPFSSR